MFVLVCKKPLLYCRVWYGRSSHEVVREHEVLNYSYGRSGKFTRMRGFTPCGCHLSLVSTRPAAKELWLRIAEVAC